MMFGMVINIKSYKTANFDSLQLIRLLILPFELVDKWIPGEGKL